MGLTTLDYLSLAWFFAGAVGYVQVADHARLRKHSVSARMNEYRERWMLEMVERDNRIVDSTIQGNLLHGVAFFASTSMLLIGGLLAALGASDQAIEVLQELPFTGPTSRTLWETKVMLLLVIMVYAFFKFAWSYRLLNYCSILIGAAPPAPVEPNLARRYAGRVAYISSRAAGHFNLGLRAIFFALAALGWFLHPLALIATTTWVIVILQRREFRSLVWKALSEKEAEG
jgi:uncharacterized membrane protein